MIQFLQRVGVFLASCFTVAIPQLILVLGLFYLIDGGSLDSFNWSILLFPHSSGILVSIYHAYKLPAGWQKYYTRWGMSKELKVSLPTEAFPLLWPVLKTELRKLNYEVTKRGDSFIFQQIRYMFSRTATLRIAQEGDAQVGLTLLQRKFSKIWPLPDFGAKMELMQAIERAVARAHVRVAVVQ